MQCNAILFVLHQMTAKACPCCDPCVSGRLARRRHRPGQLDLLHAEADGGPGGTRSRAPAPRLRRHHLHDGVQGAGLGGSQRDAEADELGRRRHLCAQEAPDQRGRRVESARVTEEAAGDVMVHANKRLCHPFYYNTCEYYARIRYVAEQQAGGQHLTEHTRRLHQPEAASIEI